jgi:hypothetical protein
MTAAAIIVRMNSTLSGGHSPRSSCESVEPSSAISAATGVGYSRATESSSGKLRLNPTVFFVVLTGIRSTSAIATTHTTIPASWNCAGSCR